MNEAQAAALRIAGRLLAYPNAEYFQRLPELAAETAELASANPGAIDSFAKAVDAYAKLMENTPKAEAGEQYVGIFDHTPAASLYMTWHRYGNDRGQGQAMGALNGLYRLAGFEPVDGDMPDYLPRMLEFFSIAPDWATDAALDGFGAEIAALEKTLADLGAPQAEFLTAALEPLRKQYPGRFEPRKGPDPTKRPMARPEPEPLEPIIPLSLQKKH